MIRLSHNRKLIMLASIFSLMAGPLVGTTLAADAIGQGFEISPPRYELTANPGQVLTTTINLRNTTSLPITAHAILNDFVPKNDSGDPGILADGSDGGTTGMKGWFSPVADQLIQPGILKTFNVRVTVPTNASPGGHYGVVRFTSGTPSTDGKNGVALSASVGTLYLVRVSGDVKENLNVSQFQVVKNGKPGTYFQSGPLTFEQEFKNTGNVHVKPTGTLIVTNLFGKKVIQTKVNDSAGNVLPGSSRKFSESSSVKFFGPYTAKMFISYGNGKQIDATAKFWVFPWQLVLIVLAILVVVFLALTRFRIEPRKRRG